MCGVGLARFGAGRRARAQGRARGRRGAQGERRAGPILRRAGWRVTSAQPTARHLLTVDGVPRAVSLRPDLSVRRFGARALAEVKTGAGRDPEHEATRRQLLEYAVASGRDRVLLVDAEGGALHEVRFPRLRRRPGGGWLLLALALGAALGAGSVAGRGAASDGFARARAWLEEDASGEPGR